ncbi:alpha/beta fold hydrolase [Mycolicibacterium thermoresistibile]|nr:hypothetical protein [Mycolicibacterium thermoresistibile]GAT14430.1 alpha/beta hydrolase [Mycolicibacterium thermoresistibile]SNW19663.1 alpha/beta hydrolase [Mycolicibacterium thermoresistibile]
MDQAVQRNQLVDPALLGASASSLRLPTLLVRGGESHVLFVDDAVRFMELVPHAEFASVAGAHHMVAGDANAVFEDVLDDFLASILHRGLSQGLWFFRDRWSAGLAVIRRRCAGVARR